MKRLGKRSTYREKLKRGRREKNGKENYRDGKDEVVRKDKTGGKKTTGKIEKKK